MLHYIERHFAQPFQALARSKPVPTEQLSVTTCADAPELFEASVGLENDTWDRLSFLDFTAAHHAHYDELLELFPDCRLCMVDMETGELVATGMCVPLRVEPGTDLPHEGWDWIVDTASAQRGRRANVMGALSISVPQQHRHRGFARDMINAMRALAVTKRHAQVIAPVRPSAKCQHPFVNMDDYIAWSDDRGRIFDPWLRSHVAVGGEIVGVCDRSMVVEQSLDFWKPWTGRDLEESGLIPFDGALSPLQVDRAAGIGRYVEPNVWVAHRV